MIKRSLLLAFALVSAPLVFAESEWDKGWVVSLLNNESGPYLEQAGVEIAQGNGEKRRIYFSYFTKSGSTECSDSTKDGKFEEIVFGVNNQAVPGIWYCKNIMEKGVAFYEFRSRTGEGDALVENAFKKSELVTVEAMGIRYTFSTLGFNAAWNARGGDAL